MNIGWRHKINNRMLFSLLTGTLFGGFLFFGAALSRFHTIQGLSPIIYLFLIFYIMLFTAISYIILKKMDSCVWEQEHSFGKYRLKSFLMYWACIFIFWIPVFLAYYPTIWAYDVDSQIPSITGRRMTTHHPLLHTIFMDSIMSFAKKQFDSYEVGMVLLSVIQMLVMACIFAYALETMHVLNVKKIYQKLLFIYFAVFPLNSIMAVSMTKDTLFSGFFLVFCLELYKLTVTKGGFFGEKKTAILFGVMLFLMLSFRNNTLYAAIPWIIISFFLIGKENRTKLLTLCIGIVAVFMVSQNILMAILPASEGRKEEAFAVPMQCLVGTAIRHPEKIPEYGNHERLFGVIDRDLFPEKLEESFSYSNADCVKDEWKEQDESDFNSVALLKSWIKNGLFYPLDYIDIWGNLMLGAYYPFDTTHANVYPWAGERHGYLLTFFTNVWGKNVVTMERPASKLPALENALEEIASKNHHQAFPIVSLFFAPASYVWLMLWFLIYCIYRKSYKKLTVYLILFLYWLTVLLGPTVLVRYLYPVMIVMPVMVILELSFLFSKYEAES